MRLVLFGPPGAARVHKPKRWNLFSAIQISTGDLLRQAQAEGTELGNKAAEFMRTGKLVPDEVVVGLIEERTKQLGNEQGYILDGFPRTMAQLDALQSMLNKNGQALDKVLSINVPEELLMERLCGRWSCKTCGAVMHERDFIGSAEKFCVSCSSSELYQREDDKPEAIQQRLRTFEDQTAPVKAKYGEIGLLANVDGVGSPEDVFNRIKKTLK